MKVEIPFRPQFKIPLLADIKVMTVRLRPMGNPGDEFEAFGSVFILTHVMRMRLGYVANDCYIQEGCKTKGEFIGIYMQIHPSKGFDQEAIVWAHCFRRQSQPNQGGSDEKS